jgi:hypothetical protein
MTTPNDPRLPTAGEQICGLFDVQAAARPNLAINRLVDFADSEVRYNVFNGFDYTISAHLRDKLILSGGASTGRVHNVNCETFDSLTCASAITRHRGLLRSSCSRRTRCRGACR